MDSLFLLLFIIPVIGYVIYKWMTYDWDQWYEHRKDMGDDIF
jgi:hypothetical protein